MNGAGTDRAYVMADGLGVLVSAACTELKLPLPSDDHDYTVSYFHHSCDQALCFISAVFIVSIFHLVPGLQ